MCLISILVHDDSDESSLCVFPVGVIAYCVAHELCGHIYDHAMHELLAVSDKLTMEDPSCSSYL